MLPHLVPILTGGRRFEPQVLFQSNEPGFWYDPSDLSSMYQDSAGTTPVTAVEQAVGLILDKSKGLVLGPELVTNGDFATNSDWTLEAGSTISGGALNVVAPGSAVAAAKQSVTFVPGRMYQITFTLTGSGTGLSINIPGASGISRSAAGTYTQFLIPTLTGELIVSHRGGAGWTGTVDNISVRELAGNHAIQPGATNRPILRSRYNLALGTEAIGGANWTNYATAPTMTSATDPLGGSTATTLDDTDGAGFSGRTQNFTVTAGGYSASAYVKAGTADGFSIWAIGSVDGVLLQDSLTWAAGVPTGTGWTAISVGGGYYRVSKSFTAVAATQTLNIYLLPCRSIASLTGSTTFWGVDVRRSCDTYLPYQRIAAATDYDVVGFPVYLAFDGSDDSLYTGGSIDFSATDKITVWAGVTKLSDANVGSVVCYGANYTNAPGFEILAPETAGQPRYGIGASSTVAGAQVGYNASFAAPTTNVVTGVFDVSSAPEGNRLQMRVDGAAQSLTVSGAGIQAGNFGSARITIGARNLGVSERLNGRLYQAICRGAATSAALIQQADRWVAGKQGRAL